MKHYHSVLCVGSFFTRNFGDRAIFQAEKAAFTSKKHYRFRAFPLKPIYANRRGSSMGILGKILAGMMLIPSHFSRLYQRVRSSDAVLIGGGNLIHDVNPLTVVQFLLVCITIRIARKNFWIFAVGAGPLQGRFSLFCIYLACKLSNAIMVRDTYSFKTISKCGDLSDRLRKRIAPDVVFSVDSTSERTRQETPRSKLLIGISVMFYMHPQRYPGGNQTGYMEYLDRMKKLVRGLVKNLEAEVILFSNEPSEDQETVDELFDKVKDLGTVRRSTINSTKSVLKVTGCCDLHIGARLHSLIFSLTQLVPSIALTSHCRISGLFHDLDAVDLLYDINNFVPEDVIQTAKNLRGNRAESLIANVKKLKDNAKCCLTKMEEEIQKTILGKSD